MAMHTWQRENDTIINKLQLKYMKFVGMGSEVTYLSALSDIRCQKICCLREIKVIKLDCGKWVFQWMN